jgi:rare lipoprotein A (peptidoglycan hydrolase)
MDHHITNHKIEAHKHAESSQRMSAEGGHLLSHPGAGKELSRYSTNTGDKHIPHLTITGDTQTRNPRIRDGADSHQKAVTHSHEASRHAHSQARHGHGHERSHGGHARGSHSDGRHHSRRGGKGHPAADNSDYRDPNAAPHKDAPSAAGETRHAVASWYHEGSRTANGERYNPDGLTVASKTLPFGTRLEVTNPANGNHVIVRVNDRGPFVKGRDLDLSRGAARQLGIISQGVAHIDYKVLG